MAKDLTISYLLDYYGDLLTEKQRNQLELYYNEDLSLGEIAELEGISRQGVRDSVKRSEAILFDLEEKLHAFESSRTQFESLREIYELANQIDEYNSKFCYSSEIEARIKRILALTEDFFKE